MVTLLPRLSVLAFAALAFSASLAQADDKVLNIYSARHYQTDEALYANFTKQTGIKVNRLDGKEDELLERQAARLGSIGGLLRLDEVGGGAVHLERG